MFHAVSFSLFKVVYYLKISLDFICKTCFVFTCKILVLYGKPKSNICKLQRRKIVFFSVSESDPRIRPWIICKIPAEKIQNTTLEFWNFFLCTRPNKVWLLPCWCHMASCYVIILVVILFNSHCSLPKQLSQIVKGRLIKTSKNLEGELIGKGKPLWIMTNKGGESTKGKFQV